MESFPAHTVCNSSHSVLYVFTVLLVLIDLDVSHHLTHTDLSNNLLCLPNYLFCLSIKWLFPHVSHVFSFFSFATACCHTFGLYCTNLGY